MDFSIRCTVKNESSGETNYAPVPIRFARELDKTGLRIHTFYDYVTSGPIGTQISTTEPLRTFHYFCLTQLIDGDAFYYNPQKKELSAFPVGNGLLIPPGIPHRYGGYKKDFTEDSICFSGPAAEALFRAGILREGILSFGKERRMLPIIRLLREATLASQFEASAELLSLLIQLHKENLPSAAKADSPHRRIQPLIDEILRSRRIWSVDEMAEYANMSTNQLRKLFHEHTGASPKQFLERLWLNQAIKQVCTSNHPLLDVARRTDCADPYYFFRRFKKLTGYTPAQYRKIYGHKISAELHQENLP